MEQQFEPCYHCLGGRRILPPEAKGVCWRCQGTGKALKITEPLKMDKPQLGFKMEWKIDKEGWHKPVNLLYEYVAVDPIGEQLILDGSFSPEQLREILAYYEKIEE